MVPGESQIKSSQVTQRNKMSMISMKAGMIVSSYRLETVQVCYERVRLEGRNTVQNAQYRLVGRILDVPLL